MNLDTLLVYGKSFMVNGVEETKGFIKNLAPLLLLFIRKHYLRVFLKLK